MKTFLMFKCSDSDLIQTWYDDRHNWTYLIQGHMDVKKAEISAPIISQSNPLVWMEFRMLLRLAGPMNLIIFVAILKEENLT